MLTKNSGFDLHFMLYGRTDHMSTNTSAFALLLTAGGVRIRSLEIHCRIDPIPRSILSCLVFLTNLKSLR